MSHLSSHSVKKRTFTLKNIELTATNLKYGLYTTVKEQKDLPVMTTKISDVITEAEHPISFLDENRKNYNTSITMVEWSKNKKIPEQTSLSCFWCRHTFDTKPIGCPIKYVNSLIEKNYISHITKDKYYMKENITPNKLNSFSDSYQEDDLINISPIKNNYYLVDGIFCSFNCALAFIKEHNHDVFYKESYSLLNYLYYAFIGKKEKLLSAPHWRLLKEYGGNLTIEEFRNTFYRTEYEFMFNVRDIKEMRSISKVFKEINLTV
jgi:hypothetical protein